MSMQSRLLNRAIQLSEAGNQDDARRLLQAVIRKDPRNEKAWFSYVRILDTIDERIQALREFLRIDPANRRAQEVLWMLWEKKCSTVTAKRQTFDRSRRFLYIALSAMVLVALIAGGALLRREVLDRWANRYNSLLEEHNGLAEDYQSLNLEHSGLRIELENVWSDYHSLAAEHNTLMDQHSRLQGTYDGLVVQHERLQRDHDSLVAAHDALLAEHQTLQDAHNSLTADYDWLNTNALSPPYISVKGREVYIAFLRTDGAVEHWEVPFESLEYSLQMGAEKRQAAWWERDPEVHLNNTFTGETYTLWDYRAFVDPGPFDLVMTELYWEAANDYDFIYETWNIVAQLTAYSEDIGDTPRYPLETFLAGGGDCEDTSILFASMIKAAPVDWEVKLVYMDMDHLQEPQDVDHVIVAVNTGTQSYLVETTSDYEMLPFDNVRGWYFEIE